MQDKQVKQGITDKPTDEVIVCHQDVKGGYYSFAICGVGDISTTYIQLAGAGSMFMLPVWASSDRKVQSKTAHQISTISYFYEKAVGLYKMMPTRDP